MSSKVILNQSISSERSYLKNSLGTALSTTTNTTIELLPDTYSVNDSNIGIGSSAQVNIRIYGKGSTIITPTTGGDHTFTITNAQNVYVSGIKFMDGTGINVNSLAVGGGRVVIDDCDFTSDTSRFYSNPAITYGSIIIKNCKFASRRCYLRNTLLIDCEFVSDSTEGHAVRLYEPCVLRDCYGDGKVRVSHDSTGQSNFYNSSLNVEILTTDALNVDIGMFGSSYLVYTDQQPNSIVLDTQINSIHNDLSGKLDSGANIDLASTYKIINSANPVNAQDLATKAYVDSASGGTFPLTADVSFGGFKASNVADGVLDTDSVNKRQLDDGVASVINFRLDEFADATAPIKIADGVLAGHAVTKAQLDTVATTISDPTLLRLDEFQDATAPITFPDGTELSHGCTVGQMQEYTDVVFGGSGGSAVPSSGVVQTDLDMQNTYKIFNVIDPVNEQDAATKAYVDSAKDEIDVGVLASGETIKISKGALVIEDSSTNKLRMDWINNQYNVTTLGPTMWLYNRSTKNSGVIYHHDTYLNIRSTGTNVYTYDQNIGVRLNTGSTSWSSTSDARLKENVMQSPASWDLLQEIKDINVYNFNFIGHEKQEIGFIAQELKTKSLLRECVDGEESEQDYLSLDYNKLTAYMFRSLQLLTRKVEAMESVLTNTQRDKISRLLEG